MIVRIGGLLTRTVGRGDQLALCVPLVGVFVVGGVNDRNRQRLIVVAELGHSPGKAGVSSDMILTVIGPFVRTANGIWLLARLGQGFHTRWHAEGFKEIDRIVMRRAVDILNLSHIAKYNKRTTPSLS